MYNKRPHFRNSQRDDMQSKNLCLWEVGAEKDPA